MAEPRWLAAKVREILDRTPANRTPPSVESLVRVINAEMGVAFDEMFFSVVEWYRTNELDNRRQRTETQKRSATLLQKMGGGPGRGFRPVSMSIGR